MASTAIADIINPEVLADQISAKFPDYLVLGGTSLVDVDSTFPLGSPGTRFKMPFWKRIPVFTDLVEGTAMTPNKITAAAENATVVRGGQALQVLDTAELVSKADPVGEISSQLARRAAEYIDTKLVQQLELTPNVFDQTGSLKTNGNGTTDQNSLILAMIQTLGDNHASIMNGGAIIMHSKPFGDLLTTGAIQNQYQSGLNVIKDGVLPTILGLPIIVSDRATVTSTSGSANKYNSYIVGPGALALFYQRTVLTEYDRDILLQADVIASTVHFAPHLYGYDDVTASIVAEQAKSIHAVLVKSN